MPIPGDATHVRWRTTSLSSGSIPFSIYPWRPYVPGTVVATLYDATSAVNTALSVRQQLSGWTTLLWGFSSASSSGMTYGVYDLDDVGAIIGAYVFSIGSPSMYGSLGAGVSGNVSGALLGTTAASAISPKRSDFSSAGIVGGTSRIRIEARR
jgi:hypothetical protein